MCEVIGNPKPLISWFKDEVAVNDEFVSENGTVLTVRNARPQDAVNYRCSVTNTVRDLGKFIPLSVSASAQLLVIGMMQVLLQYRSYSLVNVAYLFLVPPRAQTKASIVVIKGGMARLECLVTGIPLPSVHWIRDGEEMVLDGKRERLEIESASLLDEGRYDCIAVNKGGRATSSVTVDVHCECHSSHAVIFV